MEVVKVDMLVDLPWLLPLHGVKSLYVSYYVTYAWVIVSCTHTTFFLLYSDGEKGLVNALYNFCSTNPRIYVWLLMVLKGRKGSLIGAYL